MGDRFKYSFPARLRRRSLLFAPAQAARGSAGFAKAKTGEKSWQKHPKNDGREKLVSSGKARRGEPRRVGGSIPGRESRTEEDLSRGYFPPRSRLLTTREDQARNLFFEHGMGHTALSEGCKRTAGQSCTSWPSIMSHKYMNSFTSSINASITPFTQ